MGQEARKARWAFALAAVSILGAALYFGVVFVREVGQSLEVRGCATACRAQEVTGRLVGGWEIRDDRLQTWSVRDAQGAGPEGDFLPGESALLSARGTQVRAWSVDDELAAVESSNEIVPRGEWTTVALSVRLLTVLGLGLWGAAWAWWSITIFRGRGQQIMPPTVAVATWLGFVLSVSMGMWRVLSGWWFLTPLVLGTLALFAGRIRSRIDPGLRTRVRSWWGPVVTVAIAVGLVGFGMRTHGIQDMRAQERLCAPGVVQPCAQVYPAVVGPQVVKSQRRGGTYQLVYFEIDDTRRVNGLFDRSVFLTRGDHVQVAVHGHDVYWVARPDGSVVHARGRQPWVVWIFYGAAALMVVGAGAAARRKLRAQALDATT